LFFCLADNPIADQVNLSKMEVSNICKLLADLPKSDKPAAVQG
jgi:hypothetical protein